LFGIALLELSFDRLSPSDDDGMMNRMRMENQFGISRDPAQFNLGKEAFRI
jgi:hypothetical protein